MSETLNKEQIKNLLPHREPMLLVDELINIKKLSSATAIVNVKKDSFFVNGHFPGEPVMPGVLIVEAFGQAAAALTANGLDKATYDKEIRENLLWEGLKVGDSDFACDHSALSMQVWLDEHCGGWANTFG